MLGKSVCCYERKENKMLEISPLDCCEFKGSKKRANSPRLGIKTKNVINSKGTIKIRFYLTGNVEFCRKAISDIGDNKHLKTFYCPTQNILLFDFCSERSKKTFKLSFKHGMFSAYINAALIEFAEEKNLSLDSIAGDYEPIIAEMANRSFYGIHLG